MSVYLDAFRQCFFIPPPPLTEENLPSQAGRVFIVTGGYAGKHARAICTPAGLPDLAPTLARAILRALKKVSTNLL